MKSSNDDEGPSGSPIALIQKLRAISRSNHWQQEGILDQLDLEFKRLSVSSKRSDISPMIKDKRPAPSPHAAVNPFEPGVRVWIKKGTAHGGKNGTITSRNPRKGGIFWNVELDNPPGKSIYKKEQNLVL